MTGLAFGLSVIFLLMGLQRGSLLWLALSMGAVTAGLLTREDTLSAVPIMILLGHVYARRRGGERTYELGVYGGLLAALCVALMVYRSLVVPEARSIDFRLGGVLSMAIKMLNTIGLTWYDAWTQVLISVWALMVIGVIGALVALRRVLSLRVTGLWLVCAMLACSTGLNVSRSNLLLFPVTFSTLFVGSALAELWRVSRVSKALIGVVFLWGLAGGSYVSFMFAQSFHPYSSVAVKWNGEFIYGQHAEKAKMPSERRDLMKRQLASVGIRARDDLGVAWNGMAREALSAGRRTPGRDGVLFVPRFYAGSMFAR